MDEKQQSLSRYEGFDRGLERLIEAVNKKLYVGALDIEQNGRGYLKRGIKGRGQRPLGNHQQAVLNVIMPILREVYARGAQYDETWLKEKKKVYSLPAWKELRYRVLVAHGAKCKCCGATAASGAVMHVDHIKPVSLYPELALEFDNLQVLCGECNIGKSNKDETDWRVAEVAVAGVVRPTAAINGKS